MDFSEPYTPYLTGWPAAVITLVFLLVCAVLTVLFFAGMVWFYLRMRQPRDHPLVESGTPARARILEIHQTGLFVNYNPQVSMRLEVTPAEGGKYETALNAVVPIVQIPQCQPGAEMRVLVDPENPLHVIPDPYRGQDVTGTE